MSTFRWLACVLAASAGAWVACSDRASGNVEVPLPCTHCRPEATSAQGKQPGDPGACAPQEVEQPYEPCASHACCAPKDGGPCEGTATIDCLGGETCALSARDGSVVRTNACIPHAAGATTCGNITCLAPCTCRSEAWSTCECPTGSCRVDGKGSLPTSCAFGQACIWRRPDAPTCVPPDEMDGGTPCGEIVCDPSPLCSCVDASTSACACRE